MAAEKKTGATAMKKYRTTKKGNRVRVLLRRQAADNIANHLHQGSDDDGYKYHVRHFKARKEWLKKAMMNRMVLRILRTREGQ
jgi:hypothetical protein